MAVNAYIDERRMTEHVDIVSPRAQELSEELRQFLTERLKIAVRVRTIRDGIGFRLYQLTKPTNRHLADVRPVTVLSPAQMIEGILIVTPAEVVAGKVISYVRRKGKPKSFTDRRDLAHMLLKFPELKTLHGTVEERLREENAGEESLAFWQQLVEDQILPEEDDDEFA
jgi:hypothetical protein